MYSQYSAMMLRAMRRCDFERLGADDSAVGITGMPRIDRASQAPSEGEHKDGANLKGRCIKAATLRT